MRTPTRRLMIAILTLLVFSTVGAVYLIPSPGTPPEQPVVALPATGEMVAYFAPDGTEGVFRAGGVGSGATLSRDGVTLALGTQALRILFVDASAAVQLLGQDPAQARAHFYNGNDPARWRESVAMYARLLYRDLYPGVDLVYSLANGLLESEFTLHPGAALDQIKVAYAPPASLALQADGSLLIELDGISLREAIPSAYQPIDGQNVPVDVRFRLLDDRSYGFAVAGPWDPAFPLIIDPALSFATFLGGSERDEGWAIATDEQGNSYVTGVTFSVDFPSVNVPPPTYQGNKDVFVAKFNAAGALVYATFFGGAESEEGNCIGIDAAGNAYVAGQTFSRDFPLRNPWRSHFGGHEEAYFARLDPQGMLVFASYFGGSSADEVDDLVVDAAGNFYLAGEIYSDDLVLVNPWQSQTFGVDDEDAFLAIFNAYGTLIYSTYFGANQRDQIFRLALGNDGMVYAAGMTSSPSFPVVNPAQRVYGGGWDDCFVLKFDPWNNRLIYSTFLGGNDRDECWGLAVDSAGNAYVSGHTNSRNFPLARPLQPAYGGGEYDAFVASLNPAGNQLVYSTFIGGQGSDHSWDLALDSGGNVYVIGGTDSVNFPLVRPIQSVYGGGESDAFLLQLDNNGTLRFSSYLGGAAKDVGFGLAVGSDWVVHITGGTWSPDMPTWHPVQYYHGYTDVFVAYTGLVPTPTPTPTPTPSALGSAGPDGGLLWLAYSDHLVALSVPPGVLDASSVVTLTYERRSDQQGDLRGFDQFFAVTSTAPLPSTAQPFQLILGLSSYSPVSSPTLYYFNAGWWVTDNITIAERTDGHIIAWIASPGSYGVLGEANHIYLPLVYRNF